MTLKEFFAKNYLFDPTPSPESRLYIPLLVIFSLLVIVAVVMKVLPIQYDRMARRYSISLLVSGIFGLLHLFGRYEALPWLGSRFVLVVIMFVFTIWMVINIVWALRSIPEHTRERKKQDRYLKYLPKSSTRNT